MQDDQKERKNEISVEKKYPSKQGDLKLHLYKKNVGKQY